MNKAPPFIFTLLLDRWSLNTSSSAKAPGHLVEFLKRVMKHGFPIKGLPTNTTMYQIPQWTCVLISSLCWFPASNQFFFCEHLFLYISINIKLKSPFYLLHNFLSKGPMPKVSMRNSWKSSQLIFLGLKLSGLKWKCIKGMAWKVNIRGDSFWGNWCHCTDWYEITCSGRDRYSGQRTPSPSYWSDPSPRFCLLHFCLWSHSSRSHHHLPPSLAPS